MPRQPSDTENKLLLLHAIDCLGAVTAEQLLQFVVENDQMDYISLQLFLSDMVESGLLRRQKHHLGELYGLTDEGQAALALFRERVPHSRLASVAESAALWRERFSREKQMVADFSKKANGEYIVYLRLLEKSEALLQMEISVPTHTHAQRFCDAWVARAPEIYAGIMHSLGETPEESNTEP